MIQISGYTLTVLASDNGSPPKSSSATVNIDVSDVNDNAPVFSQANYSLVLQVRVLTRRRAVRLSARLKWLEMCGCHIFCG